MPLMESQHFLVISHAIYSTPLLSAFTIARVFVDDAARSLKMCAGAKGKPQEADAYAFVYQISGDEAVHKILTTF